MLHVHFNLVGKLNFIRSDNSIYYVMSHHELHQLTLPDDIQSTRWVHSVTAISLAPDLTEVTMFGGSNSPYLLYGREAQKTCIAATTIISFGELNLIAVHKEGAIIPCAHVQQEVKHTSVVRSPRRLPELQDYCIIQEASAYNLVFIL